MLNNKFIVICAIALSGMTVVAQNEKKLDQSVQVVRDYAPSVPEAVKMHQMPVLDDTSTYKPSFHYSVLDKVNSVTTKPELISAASMNYRNNDLLYRSFVRAGLGNYSTIGGDYTYNIAQNNDYLFSFNIGHRSSLGSLKLEDGTKQDAPFHDTEGGLNFKYFAGKYTFSSNLKFDNHRYRFYGLQQLGEDDEFVVPGVATPVKGRDLYGNVNERWTGVDVGLGFANNLDPEATVKFDSRLDLGFFGTKTGVKQNGFGIGGSAGFMVSEYDAGIDVSIDHFKVSIPDSIGPMYSFNERSNTLIQIKPHVDFDFDRFKLRAGIAIVTQIEEDGDELYLMPDVKGVWNVAEDYVTLHAALKGGYRTNSYRSVIEENPFVSADVNVLSSATPIAIEGGVNARFSPVVALNASVGYSIFTDEHFFVNKEYVDTLDQTGYSARFVPVYDDGGLLKAKGELVITPGNNSEIRVSASYFGWQTDHIEEAWHKHDSEFALNFRFYPIDKLLINGGVTLIGRRFAEDPVTKLSKKLDPVVDLSLGGEYMITRQFSVFARINNVAASKYYRWNGYPSQGLNVFGGLAFSF
jgi:hypothetical protein